MNPLAAPIVAALLAVASHGHATSHAHGGSPSHSGGSSAHAATAHAMAAQHHAALQQLHAYQQALHQQKMVQEHMVQQYQRAIHEQMKARVLAHPTASPSHPATSVPSAARSSLPGVYALGSSSYLNSSHHYHHSPHHYYHHRSYSHRPYRHYPTWPATQDPEYAALIHLKETLDDVVPRSARWGAARGTGNRSAIGRALMGIVEVNQAPSVAAIDRLASDLEEALASRSETAVDTSTLALALRGGVNYSALIAAERTQVIRELQATLKHGGVPVPQVEAVVASLHNVGRQEQPQHARR